MMVMRLSVQLKVHLLGDVPQAFGLLEALWVLHQVGRPRPL